MALQFWRNLGKQRKNKFVALEQAYHGDTVGAMSVGADSDFVAAFQELRFAVWRVPSAHCFRCPVGKQRATCDNDCACQLARLLEVQTYDVSDGMVATLLAW